MLINLDCVHIYTLLQVKFYGVTILTENIGFSRLLVTKFLGVFL